MANAQVWGWIIGTVILAIASRLRIPGHSAGRSIAAVGSIIVLVDMLLFGWPVFRAERTKASVQPAVR